MKSLYQLAVEQMDSKDIDHNNLGSDLYLRRNKTSKRLIDEYELKQNVKTFIDQIDGVPWYDIPFVYDPYWEEKCGKQ